MSPNQQLQWINCTTSSALSPASKMDHTTNSFSTTVMTTISNISQKQQLFHHRTAATSLRHDQQQQEKPRTSMMLRRRSALVSAMVLVGAASAMLEARRPAAQAADDIDPNMSTMRWGTHSFIKEKYFQPQLSPEDAVARIRQTTEGLREMRHMLDTMSWRYVMFYIRLKSAYLDSDLRNAMATLPQARRNSYVKAANQVVDYMTELDRYVRSPKVYESYLYYEKALESLDELVAILA